MNLLSPKLKNLVYWEKKRSFQLHEDTYEDWVAFIVEHGEFRYRIREQQDTATFGDIVLCPPHTVFKREVISPLTFYYVLFECIGQKDVGSPTSLPWGKIQLSALDRLRDNLALMGGRQSELPSLHQAYRQHLFTDLWFMVMQAWQHRADGAQQPPQDARMKKAAVLLEQQALTKLSIQDVAAMVSLTPVQFHRRFQAAYQVNPLQYLTSIRMHHACKLLVETDWTLDAIAEACGYESGFYLSRLFHKQMKMRPSTYRSTHRL